MDRQEAMEMVAGWFRIEPDENGEFDIESYDWQAGCYMGISGKFLNLAEVVSMLETMI